MADKININWSGATDDKGITAYELAYALAPDFNNWTQIIINTTQSTVSYEFQIQNYVDHRFSIRTIDTTGQYSEYKYITQKIDNAPSLISSTSSNSGVCSIPSYIATDTINIYSSGILLGDSPVVIGNLIKTSGNLAFNGYGRYWGITHYNKSYSCSVNTSGVITESNACGPMWTINSYTNPNLTFTRNYGNDTAVTVQTSTNNGASWIDNTGGVASPRNIGSLTNGTWIRMKSTSNSSLSSVLVVSGQGVIPRKLNYTLSKTGQATVRASYTITVNGTVVANSSFDTGGLDIPVSDVTITSYLDVKQGDNIIFSIRGYNGGTQFPIEAKIKTDTLSQSKTQMTEATVTLTFTMGVSDESVVGSIYSLKNFTI